MSSIEFWISHVRYVNYAIKLQVNDDYYLLLCKKIE